MHKDSYKIKLANFFFEFIFLIVSLVGISGIFVPTLSFNSKMEGVAYFSFGIWALSLLVASHVMCKRLDEEYVERIENYPDLDRMIAPILLPFPVKKLVKIRLFRFINFYLPPLIRPFKYSKNKFLREIFANRSFREKFGIIEKLIRIMLLSSTVFFVLSIILYFIFLY